MSGPASCASRRLGERGGVSWVTLLLVVVVAGAGYLTWVWGPIYVESYTVKQVVKDYANQAIKNPNDAELRAAMVAKIHSLGQIDAVDASNRPVKVPAIPMVESEVTWQRDAQAKTLRIAFDWERQVVYPFLDRVTVTTFTFDKTEDLNRADWGPSRP
jgi:hypothetical protein